MREILDDIATPTTTANHRPAAAPREPFDVKLLRLALEALGSKLMLWFALAGAIGMWVYAVLEPEPLRLAAAGGFCASVFLPMLLRR